MTLSLADLNPFWVVTMADGIEPSRLAAVLRSWDVAGIDGILVVHGASQEVAFTPKTVPNLRLVQPAVSVAFNRATWRNIAVRFAPCQYVAFWDADCALTACDAARLVSHMRTALVTGEADFIIHAPQWSDRQQAEAYLLGDLTAIDMVGRQNPDATWAGTCALSRELAVEVSWDDEQQGWGFQDADFCKRVYVARPELKMQRALPGLVHLWHPVRGKSKQSKMANRDRSALRRGRTPAEWQDRAYTEIAMTACACPQTPFTCFGEAPLRTAVADEARTRGWRVLRALGKGVIPEDCAYIPVLGAKVVDVYG